jgi:hypothetical protein
MKFWHHLTDIRVAAQVTWREALDSDFERVSRFLVPTGATAEFVPCTKTPINHCGYKVRPASEAGTFTGFCPEDNCPRIPLTAADVALLTVDWGLLLSEAASSIGLAGSPSMEAPGVGHLGWFSIGENARFPAFVCIPNRNEATLPAIQRFAARTQGAPFILLAVSRAALDVDSLGILSASKSEPIFLEADAHMGRNGRIEMSDAAERLVRFASSAVVDTRKDGPQPMILPQGARWEDVTIKEIDGHTIKIFCRVRQGRNSREVQQNYSFENLGLAKRTTMGTKPSVAWIKFLIPILNGKRVVAADVDEWSRMRKWKEEVAAILHAVTGLPSDGAFEDYRGRSCYEAKFNVECAPSDIVPIPGAPRRINQKGKIARGPDDE